MGKFIVNHLARPMARSTECCVVGIHRSRGTAVREQATVGLFLRWTGGLKSTVKYRSLPGGAEDSPHRGDPREGDWSCTWF